jgi:hypothetical protein
MEVYISINGVLRNLIQKFEYHYNYHFLETDPDESEIEKTFDYHINYPIRNDNLMNYYTFQSIEEYNDFLFIEYPLEIFGHAVISYPAAMYDLNKVIYEHPDINFTVVGIDELGKAKSSTLFFLSKNSFLGNNIKFISSKDIDKEWKKCNVWITDNYDIIQKCPENKTVVKFNTDYNVHFTHSNEINDLTKIYELCLKSSEKTITSMSTKLLKNVVHLIHLKKSKR